MVNLVLTSTPFTSSLLRGPPSPSSPRSPLHEIYFLQKSQRFQFTQLRALSDSNIPSSKHTIRNVFTVQPEDGPPERPLPWIWRCHICQRSYPLNVTRRCLDDGHVFCAGETNIRINPHSSRARKGAVTGKRKKRKHIPCSSEFDYSGWKAYGEWRRKETERRSVQQPRPAKRKFLGAVGMRFGDAIECTKGRSGKNCEYECNYPSECRWAKKNTAVHTVTPKGFSNSSPCLLNGETIEDIEKDMAWLYGDGDTKAASSLSELSTSDSIFDFTSESDFDYVSNESDQNDDYFDTAEDESSSSSSSNSSSFNDDASEHDGPTALVREVGSHTSTQPRSVAASEIPGLCEPTTFEAILGISDTSVASTVPEIPSDVPTTNTSEEQQNPTSILDEYRANFWNSIFLDNEYSLLEPTSSSSIDPPARVVGQGDDLQEVSSTDKADDAAHELSTEDPTAEQHCFGPALVSPSSFSFAHALDLDLSLPSPVYVNPSLSEHEVDSSPRCSSSLSRSPVTDVDSSADLGAEKEDLLALPPLSLPPLCTFARPLSVQPGGSKAEKRHASWIGDIVVKAGARRKA